MRSLFGFAVLMALSFAAAGAQDGAALVQTQCGICHSMEPATHKLGPSLAMLDGRVSGTEPGYAYSPAMMSAAITWSNSTLDEFLIDPAGFLPGNKMGFAGVADANARAEILRYLLEN